MSIKRISLIIIFIAFVLYLFFNILPLIIVSPAPVYHIYNADDADHYILVHIFDENNNSILIKNYTLVPKESVELDREINWHLPFTTHFVSWNDEIYRFNFTVDGNVSQVYNRKLSQFECISVWLYHFDYQKSEIIPIEIGIMAI
jgi:ABC-type dipeptide/oligopeptide/nickel transport system permease component